MASFFCAQNLHIPDGGGREEQPPKNPYFFALIATRARVGLTKGKVVICYIRQDMLRPPLRPLKAEAAAETQ